MAESCPVCGAHFSSTADLVDHVSLHFMDDEQPRSAPAAAAAAAASPAPPAASSGHQQHAVMVHHMVQCPMGCGAMVRLEDLDSHEEAHRVQEMEAQHKALEQQQEAAEFEQLQMKFGFSDKRPGKCFRCGQEGHWSRDCPSNPAAQAARALEPLTTDPARLAQLQRPDTAVQQHQAVDVMSLLQANFQAQQKPRTTVYLSGPVTFCCGAQADAGWGCGYRNIQMQVSHLLLTSPAHRQALFGGAGFVPDIPALQAWLEVAWQAGFDPGGAAMLGAAVQRTRKWIGTTEAAAMLRYFGCRALIVEFRSKDYNNPQQQQGPTVHQGVACDVCGQAPIIGVRHKSYSTPDYDVCSSCSRSREAQRHAPFHESGSAGSGAAVGAGSSGSSRQRGTQPAAGAPPSAAAAGGNGPGPGPGSSYSGGSSGSEGGAQGRHKRKQPSADEKRADAEKHRALAEWVWAYFSSPGFQGMQQQQGVQQQQGQQGAANGVAAAAAAGGQQQARGNPGPVGNSSGGGGSNGNGGGSNGGGGSSSGGPGAPVNAFSRLQQQHPQRPTTVIMSGKPPLYFQHEGHSRTIVGIERTLPGPQQQHQRQRQAGHGSSSGSDEAQGVVEYTLVVLDPGMPFRELADSLRGKGQWQMRVKRGIHSLARHKELQLMYVAPGVVPEGPERDALKRVVAAERYNF